MDLTSPTTPPPELLQKKAFSWKKILLLCIVFFSVLGFGFVYQKIYSTTSKISQSNANTSLLTQIKYVNEEKPLQGELDDRVNILLLGLGGDNHPGGTLTDTIMVASFKPSTKQLALISIPRDLAVKIYDDANPKYWEGRKINYAYELGGMDLIQEKVSEVTGLTMNYYVWLDFDGFRKIIDDLGGLDIYVDNGFTDYEYPDYNYGYQTIQFTKGWEHMDGERALQYSRSRHGNHGEGSDFARAQRQQKIIQAFKDKLFSTSTLLNPLKLNNILETLGADLKTNAEIWEMVQAAKLIAAVDRQSIINKVIDNSEQGLLYSEIVPETGAYVLIPNAGEYNYSEIQKLSRQIFDAPSTETVAEEATLEIQNGTAKAGLAAKTAEALELYDLNVSTMGNALADNLTQTTIYDLSDSQKPETLASLKKLFPQALFKDKTEAPINNSSPDFLILLGADFTGIPENINLEPIPVNTNSASNSNINTDTNLNINLNSLPENDVL